MGGNAKRGREKKQSRKNQDTKQPPESRKKKGEEEALVPAAGSCLQGSTALHCAASKSSLCRRLRRRRRFTETLATESKRPAAASAVLLFSGRVLNPTPRARKDLPAKDSLCSVGEWRRKRKKGGWRDRDGDGLERAGSSRTAQIYLSARRSPSRAPGKGTKRGV